MENPNQRTSNGGSTRISQILKVPDMLGMSKSCVEDVCMNMSANKAPKCTSQNSPPQFKIKGSKQERWWSMETVEVHREQVRGSHVALQDMQDHLDRKQSKDKED